MIGFVGTFPSFRKALWAAMVTMHSQIALTALFMGIVFSRSEGPSEQFGTNSKLSLWCIIGQIRSWGRNQFIYDVCLWYHLINKDFIKILEYANVVISYTTTR